MLTTLSSLDDNLSGIYRKKNAKDAWAEKKLNQYAILLELKIINFLGMQRM